MLSRGVLSITFRKASVTSRKATSSPPPRLLLRPWVPARILLPRCTTLVSELVQLEAFEVAIDFFSAYAAKVGTYVTPMKLLALVYGRQGDLDKALHAYQDCVFRNPDDLRNVLELANFCLENDFIDEADEALRQAQALAPRHRDVRGLTRAVQARKSEQRPPPLPVPVRTDWLPRPDFSHITGIDLNQEFYSSNALKKISSALRAAGEWTRPCNSFSGTRAGIPALYRRWCFMQRLMPISAICNWV